MLGVGEIDEEVIVGGLNNRYILSGNSDLVLDLNPEAAADQAATFEPDIQARLVALLQATGLYGESAWICL